MISIGKVRSADYYLAEVGRDDSPGYYLDTERVGRWHGRLAETSAYRAASIPTTSEPYSKDFIRIDWSGSPRIRPGSRHWM